METIETIKRPLSVLLAADVLFAIYLIISLLIWWFRRKNNNGYFDRSVWTGIVLFGGFSALIISFCIQALLADIIYNIIK